MSAIIGETNGQNDIGPEKNAANSVLLRREENALAMGQPKREGGATADKDDTMKMNKLGRTDIEVTDFCLGSMTWGTQNTPEEGHAQIERALAAGINFIDTAEMYPVKPSG